MEGLRLEKLTRAFGEFEVLRGISFDFHLGEQYVIRGSSGSGKSSLLYLIGGLDRPTTGKIICDGYSLGDLNDDQLAKYRNLNVGFVFQFHYLLSTMNAWDNILLPCRIAGRSTKALASEVNTLADALGVEHCLPKYPYELSGGEQQRINVIRALSLHPRYILCDEPTGNLDTHNSLNVIKILKELAVEFGATLIVVTHDEMVASFFDRQLYLQDGRLIKYGDTLLSEIDGKNLR